MSNFNDRVKQLLILVLLLLLIHLVIRELKTFLPGLLGALTLYILSRAGYFQLVFNRKWKKRKSRWLIYHLLSPDTWAAHLHGSGIDKSKG